MAQSRIGEAYVQIIPTVEDLSEKITDEIVKGYEEANKNLPKPELPEEEFEESGKKGWGAFSAGLMGALAAAGIGSMIMDKIAGSIESQEINAKLAASMSLTPEQQQLVQDSASNVFKGGLGESYEEVTEVMKSIVGTISGAKDASSEELEGMAETFLNMSKTFGVGSEEMSKAANMALNTGLAGSFEEAQQLIVGGFQVLGDSGDDWLDSLNEFSGDFKRFGFEGVKSIELVQAGVAAGIKDTDVLADTLNELGIKLDAKENFEALAALGLDPEQIAADVREGGVAAQEAFSTIISTIQAQGADGQALGAAIFGTRFEDYSDAFMKIDISSITGDLEDGAGSTEKFNENFETVGQSIESFKRTFDSAFGEVIMPLLEAVTPMVQGFADFLSQNEWAANALAIVVGGVFVAAMIAATAAMWAMVPAAWAVIAPFLPIIAIILAVVAAIAALIAIGYLVVQNWESITKWLSEAFTNTVNFLGSIWKVIVGINNAVGNFFIGLINGLIDFINLGIAAINSMKIQMPDWLGGYTFSANLALIPRIPALADGGTVKARPGGTLALLAEAGKSEVVMDSGKWNNVLDQIHAGEIGGKGGSNEVTINVYQQPNEDPEDLVNRLTEYLDFASLRGDE